MLFNMNALLTISLVEAVERKYDEALIENLKELRNNYRTIRDFIKEQKIQADELSTNISSLNDHYTLMLGHDEDFNSIERYSTDFVKNFNEIENDFHVTDYTMGFNSCAHTTISKLSNTAKPSSLYDNMTIYDKGDNVYTLSYAHIDSSTSYVMFKVYDDLNNIDTEHTNFMVSDLYGILEACNRAKRSKILHVYNLYVQKEYRHLGLGSLLINILTDMYQDYYIVTDAAASITEYPDLDKEYPENSPEFTERCREISESLIPFYVDNNFFDVNEYIGNYESKISFLYMNRLGGELYMDMPEIIKSEFKKEVKEND